MFLSLCSFSENYFLTAVVNLLNVSLEARNNTFIYSYADIPEKKKVYIINAVLSDLYFSFGSFQTNYYSGCISTKQSNLNISSMGFFSCFCAISLITSKIIFFNS